jgi:regulator of RNase E activity RraA
MKPVDVPDTLLARFRKLPVATIWHSVHEDGGVLLPFIEGVRTFTPGKRLAGRARTVRYLPMRPDLMSETRTGETGPEYRAMGRCGPGEVLVADQMGFRWSAIAGDVKLLQLKMNKAEGLVTDGAIRDLGVIEDEEYGLIVYARERTPFGQGPWSEPAEENVDIQCGGALVRPGDVIVGDDDGCVVVPSWFASECADLVEAHEEDEAWIKDRILADRVPPGKYYNQQTFAERRRARGG